MHGGVSWGRLARVLAAIAFLACAGHSAEVAKARRASDPLVVAPPTTSTSRPPFVLASAERLEVIYRADARARASVPPFPRQRLSVPSTTPLSRIPEAKEDTPRLAAIDLAPRDVLPLLVSAASPAHRAAAEAYSTARLARRACKDDACIAKGSAAVTFAEVTLTRALGKGPLSLPDAALRGYLEAERARATRAEDGSTPPPSRDLLRVRAAAPDGSPLHFAAAYILAHAEDDPGERRRLLEALVKSPPPKGYVRSELLFWIGQLSSTPAEAVRFFRQAHEAAHQERERGDASEGVVEIATAYAWLRAATGHLPPEVPPAVHAIVVYIAHKPPASSEGVEDFETEIAPAIAWAIDRGASFRGVRVTSRAWEQAALALATRTRARGDEVVASRAESLAHAPETELRPIPTWGLGETRVRALELERACAAASESPSPIKPHSLVVKDGVVSVTRPEEHEGSEMACIRERGARYLWNAPNIEIDVVPEK